MKSNQYNQFTRRSVLKNGTAIAAFASLPNVSEAVVRHSAAEPLLMDVRDERVKEICAAAISAAREAGASYADIRLSHTYIRKVGGIPPETELMSAGVRALVDGYWGFASSPIWSNDEGARLGRAAIRQAKANNIAGPRELEFAAHENATSGEWIMPVKDDPFELNFYEVEDFLASLTKVMERWPGVSPFPSSAEFKRLDKFFASTLNQEFFQRTYLTSADVGFRYKNDEKQTVAFLDTLTPAGKGFEHIRDQDIARDLHRLYEETREELKLPVKPVDVGRHPVILERRTLAQLLHKTIGPATELDRILGYEANSTGTSFINDPVEMLGSLKIASPQVTITSDRSMSGGAATVRWDDEGVEPQKLTVIEKGILKGVHADRQRAGWLNKNLSGEYGRMGSTGNMVSDMAYVPPNIFFGNIAIEPGSDSTTEQSLLEQMENGIYIKSGNVNVDFQLSSGIISGSAFEVKKGKRTAMLTSLGLLFKTSELWSLVERVGGRSSQRIYGYGTHKTNYLASTTTSIAAVPALFKEGTIIDVTRKA